MWRTLTPLPLLIGLGWFSVEQTVSPARAESGYAALVTMDRAIDPVSARHLARAINTAAAEGAQLVVITLNTPGGLLESTRTIVQSILGSRIPTVVYVAPSGARAASAGTFVTAAANFAAMAPGTNIGAASPVAIGGQDIPTTLARKINEDTRAFIRSIAEQRGRNVSALEETVIKASSYSAREAAERDVVDFLATDLTDLLTQLDGRTARTSSGTVTLRTQNIDVQDIGQTPLETFLRRVAHPDIAFVLLTIGGLGILVEFLTPGFIGPGVVGIIALGLALVGLGNLPVNWVAVGLIAFSMFLLYLEAAAPGFGLFGVGGLVSFALGGFLLFGDFFGIPDIPEPSFRVSGWVIAVMAGLVAVPLFLFMYGARSGGAEAGYIPTAKSALIGRKGVAVSDLAPSGRVRVADEEWTATTDLGDVISEGEDVRVIGVYGDVLKVSKDHKDFPQEEK